VSQRRISTGGKEALDGTIAGTKKKNLKKQLPPYSPSTKTAQLTFAKRKFVQLLSQFCSPLKKSSFNMYPVQYWIGRLLKMIGLFCKRAL